jgi:hypothetical protein
MRYWLPGLLLLLVLLLLGCGSGEKPEFVEVPSGDPMAPAGEGTPIQDAQPGQNQGCSQTAEPPPLPKAIINPDIIRQRAEPTPAPEPQRSAVPTILVLLVPAALGWALRRPR